MNSVPVGFPVPTIFDINESLKKVRFFLGDRWIIVGDIVYHFEQTGPNNGYMHTLIPNLQTFLEQRKDLNDGSLEWARWGPRVN